MIIDSHTVFHCCILGSVANRGGPAIFVGSLATTRRPESKVTTNTLLNPPAVDNLSRVSQKTDDRLA